MGNRIFDQYSLLHFSVGVVAYFIGIDFWVWFILHMIFEIVENSDQGINLINNNLSFFWPGGKERSDAVINSVGDQISAMLGWLVAQQVDKIGKNRGWYFNRHY